MKRLVLILICALLPTIALAQSAPLDEALAASTAQKTALQKEMQALESEMDKTRKALISSAEAVQKNEKNLSDLDTRMRALETQKTDIEKKLETGRASTARLMMALTRLRRMPPEALILRPETPLKTAQSALLLKNILPTLQKQVADLKTDLNQLAQISHEIESEKQKVLAAGKALKKEQAALKTLTDQRKTRYAAAHKDLQEQEERIASISKQAKNMADLLKRLEEERRKAQEAAIKAKIKQEKEQELLQIAKKTTLKAKEKIQAFVQDIFPATGKGRLPISGTVITGFGQPDNFGAPSQGLDIEGRTGALVIAPMGGIIRFAGEFKNYGKMVILEHEKGWHSLIAGLEKIDTVVGQSISAGEPLGILHTPQEGRKPVLYYELRHNGKPVNPSQKLG